MSRNWQESRPQMERDLEQRTNDSNIYSIGTVGGGGQEQTQDVVGQHYIPEKRGRFQNNNYGGNNFGGNNQNFGGGGGGGFKARDKSQVTCFKCMKTGHYANECSIPKLSVRKESSMAMSPSTKDD